jgi:membrane-associated phospholipid phosphatase
VRPVATVLRPYAFAVLLAAAAAVVSVVVAAYFDLPLRDPDGIAGPAYVRLPLIVVLFLTADIVPRLVRRRGVPINRILRQRLSPERLGLVTAGMASFYVSYVAYRNLKGALPFARPKLHDEELLRLDEWMAFGHDPALLLHDLLGTGTAAYVLSFVYLLYLLFVPLSLGAALVWGRNVRIGSWYVTALCLNWLLGAVSYYLVPSLGPVFVHPERYAVLPETGVSLLQENLARARLEVLADPTGADAIAGVAGFASLHCSVVFTAVLMAHLARLPIVVRAALWVFLLLTITATAYFGWHYLIDDVAGLLLGAASVLIAERVTRRAPTTVEPIAEERELERV